MKEPCFSNDSAGRAVDDGTIVAEVVLRVVVEGDRSIGDGSVALREEHHVYLPVVVDDRIIILRSRRTLNYGRLYDVFLCHHLFQKNAGILSALVQYSISGNFFLTLYIGMSLFWLIFTVSIIRLATAAISGSRFS